MDSDRLETAYERQFAELYALAKRPAMKVLSNSVDAEDVAAETLARLYLNWSKLVDRDTLKPWVVRVATNLAVDQVRRTNRRRRPLRDDAAGPPPPDTHLVLVQAVSRLPRRQRQVVSLRYFADLTDEDISVGLSISVPTVRTHLQRALPRLASLLGPSRGDLYDMG